MVRSYLAISLVVGAALAFTCPASVFAKECYAPDARAQERAFSRAVITDVRASAIA